MSIHGRVTRARAPFRIGLAGGGTDIPAYSSIHGGHVVNATISYYVYATISNLQDKRIEIRALDQRISCTYETHHLPESIKTEVPLHLATYQHFCEAFLDGELPHLSISTYSNAPRGSGLGGSSSLVVSLLKALLTHFSIAHEQVQIASHAYIIERLRCGFSGGMQDQYASAIGGFNSITFADHNVLIDNINLSPGMISELESTLFLLDLSKSRVSSDIIDAHLASIQQSDTHFLVTMSQIRQNAADVLHSLRNHDLFRLYAHIREGWRLKTQLTPLIATLEISTLIKELENLGVNFARLTGAGGGGHILISCNLEHQVSLREMLGPIAAHLSPVKTTHESVSSWPL